MKQEIPNKLREVAHFLDTNFSRFLGADEVVVWYFEDNYKDHIGLAFRGSAERMEPIISRGTIFNKKNEIYEIMFQKSIKKGEESFPVRGAKIYFEDLKDKSFIGVGSFFHYLSFLVASMLEDEDFKILYHITIMPNIGEPWIPKRISTSYYSTKTKREKETKESNWAIAIMENGKVDHYIADFCQVVGELSNCDSRIMGHISCNKQNIGYTVTHCLDIPENKNRLLDLVKNLKSCGGLLFPSLAVGQLPTTGFGSCVLIAGATSILGNMHPYGISSKEKAVTVYNTDSWTETSSQFLGSLAEKLFDELTGARRYEDFDHFYTLGPLTITKRHGIEIIKTTRQLFNILQERQQLWNRDLTYEEARNLHDFAKQNDPGKYPYLEAKVNAVMPINCFSLCVCEEREKKEVEFLLKELNFHGNIITIKTPWSYPISFEDRFWEYAWMVHDAVMSYAIRRNSVFQIACH